MEFSSDHGRVWLDCARQGRIWAELDGEMLHRRGSEVPGPGGFVNRGGNSLWPAPEGGPLGFNYRGDDWYVPEGVNTVNPTRCADGSAVKTIELENRRGTPLGIVWTRRIAPLPLGEWLSRYGLRGVGYREFDRLDLTDPAPTAGAVVAAWSLEQFPGGAGNVAFAGFDGAPQVNREYYGDPSKQLRRSGQTLFFALDGAEKLQIGIPASARPRVLGAWCPDRELLILRRTRCDAPGVRIDIADNRQPRGVFGAEDCYSVFYGAGAGFFELETIAPMRVENGRAVGSELESETMFFRGPVEHATRFLSDHFQINLAEAQP